MRTPGATAEVTRRRVMDAAVQLFAQRGYAATGVRELAAQAGLTGPALYHYVGTKEDLLVAIMRSTTEPLLLAGRSAVADQREPAAQLAILVELHVWVHATRPQATLVADTELRALSPARRKEIVSLRDRYQALWRSVVRAGVEAGSFEVADERIATIALLELCTGVTHWYRPGGRMRLDELCATHADLALATVRARRGRRTLRREEPLVAGAGRRTQRTPRLTPGSSKRGVRSSSGPGHPNRRSSMLSIRKATVVLASGALLAAASAPAAFAQSGTADYPSDTATQSERPAKSGNRAKRARKLTTAQLTAVATRLGVTVEALKAAQAKVKAATAATEARETKAQTDALLAAELGVTAEQVRAAFASVEPQRRSGSRGDCNGAGQSGTGQGADYPTGV